MERLFIFSLFFTTAAAYSVCPQHVECIPGCVKIDERGCKCCACGPMMFHPGGGCHGMPGGMLGGSSFTPGTLGGGTSFGGGAVAEKPLKDCSGTMLCMMTCQGSYSLSKDVQSNGCRTCTCPKPQAHPVQQHVQPAAPKPAKSDCTGTKLCMLTCKGKYILGERGTDGCQSCACIPEQEPTPKPLILQPVQEQECHEMVLCMLSCKHGYSLAPKCNDKCHDQCQKCTCLESTPPPQQLVILPTAASKECPHTLECMMSCKDGYSLGSTGADGCPTCSCLAPPKAPVIKYQVQCSQALSCHRGCSVGYKCSSDGCPTCECIHPQVVGLVTVTQVYIEKEVTCQSALTCPKSCTLGYKCGEDGCPICECCVEVQTVGCTDGCDDQSSGTNIPGNVGISGSPNSGSGGSSGNGPVNPSGGGGGSFGSVPFNPSGGGGGSSGSGPFNPSGGGGGSSGSGPFNPSGGGGGSSGSGTFNPSGGGGGGGSSGSGPFNPSGGGGGSSGSGPFNPSGGGGGGSSGSGPFNPSGGGGGSGPFAPSSGNSGSYSPSSGTGNSGPFTNAGTNNNALNEQTFGPTVDSCGPFGCITGSNSQSPVDNSGSSNVKPFGNFNNLHQTDTGNGISQHGSSVGGSGTGSDQTAAGGTTGNTGHFASGIGNQWQSGSANGKGWANGGIDGPFANGQGSGSTSGQFHNSGGSSSTMTSSGGVGGQGTGGTGLNGQGSTMGSGFGKGPSQTGANLGAGVGQTQTGANLGSGMTASGPLGKAPGTGGNGPFTMNAGTGGPTSNNSGLPLSPYSAAAAGSAGAGPFAGAAIGKDNSGSGSAGAGPFAGAASGGSSSGGGQFAGYGPNPFSQSGSSGSGYSAGVGVGSGGASSGQGPFGGKNTAGSSTQVDGTQIDSNVFNIVHDCPEVMKCMKTCARGYNLQTTQGCPICTCVGDSGSGPAPGTLTNQHNVRRAAVTGSRASCKTKFSCPVKCTHGFASDMDGCIKCDCVGQPVVEPIVEWSKTCSEQFACIENCPTGYKTGQDGCPTCVCFTSVTNVKPLAAQPTQPPVVTHMVQKCPATIQCMANCKDGYTLGTEGQDGCPTCTCINKQTTECHDVCDNKPEVAIHTCDATVHCMAACTDGYELGANAHNGCPVCTCKQQTCESGCEETQHVVQLVTSSCTSNCETECTGDCGSSGATTLQLVSGGNSPLSASTGGGGAFSSGGSAFGGGGGGAMSAGRASGGGMTGGGEECPPLPPNCHPYCIKYDVAHCRLCECESAGTNGFSG